MLKHYLALCVSNLLFSGVLAMASPAVGVLEKLPPEAIVRADASSSFGHCRPELAVNGAGMYGEGHISNNGGEDMWISRPSKKLSQFRPTTRKGPVWFACELDKATRIDQIRIWNHNQNDHTRRGLKKIFIELSTDGKSWELLKDGQNDWHTVPESIGKNGEGADYILDTKGKTFKYICITADAREGNHYDMEDPIVALETSDMHQDPTYYGLAEIGFYTLKKKSPAELKSPSAMHFHASQGYLKTEDGPSREFNVAFDHPLYCPAVISFKMDGKEWKASIKADPKGVYTYNGMFPAGYMECEKRLEINLSSIQGNVSDTFIVPAARKWEVHFFSHSHQDIGYTHRQADVMKLQWRNLERAIALAERTKDYPDGSRYCWNSEATWAVAGYLAEYAGTPKADNLIKAIKDTVIGVDAFVGSVITGISRQEELMHFCDDAHIIEELTGVSCNTAMMSDVPGQVWGLVPAMAKNGVRYFSPAPNYVPFYGRIGNDRAAALHIKWGDHPFWWRSQSGTDKVLVWEAGRGYSWFHGWLAGRLSVCGLEPIWQYLEELEEEEFPYDMCYLRYTVHGDNGPADEQMPDIIKEWNETYDSPHFSISTAKKFFNDFEEKYGDSLPEYGGDMTPTWEDGAASTAKETALNRRSAATLAQSGILWCMTGGDYPERTYFNGFKNVILFSEHTWGSSDSGPNPDSKFTRDLWNGKKMYADSARIYATEAFEAATAPLKNEGGHYIQILNTNLWPRTDVVTIKASLDGKALKTSSGKTLPLQKLSDGTYAFLAEDVPALGSAVFAIVNCPDTKTHESMVKDASTLDNGLIRVHIDPLSGNIKSFRLSKDDFEYVSENGLNEYLYTGRRAANPRGIEAVGSIRILDDGPVAATIRVESSAPGCNSLSRDITIYKGLEKARITNTLDKQDIRDFESVRFIFPFNFAHPDIAMDMAMSEVHPEREQLSGVNKHYYSIQNGLSVGDLEHVICMTAVDAPFVEFGTPSGEDYRLNPHHGYGWWPSAQISPKIYSWVMNNTWRTNYKASQGGIASFTYTLQPANPIYPGLKKKGLEEEQQMIALVSDSAEPVKAPFGLKGKNEISLSATAPSKDGSGIVVSLQNLWNRPVRTGFIWGTVEGRKVYKCDYSEKCIEEINTEDFWMQPYEYVKLKIVTR